MPQQTSATRGARGEAARPVVGDLGAGGLLQAVRREVHEIGVGAELRPRPPPEPGLGERRRGQRGVVGLPSRVAAATGSSPTVSAAAERLLAAGCQQLPEGVKVHVV